MPSKAKNNEMSLSAPIHPGEILLEEFMEPFGISQNALAKDIGVSPRRVNEIVNGKRAITPDTAVRLSLYFGTSEKFWMNLQASYELDLLNDELREKIGRQVRKRAPASGTLRIVAEDAQGEYKART